METVLITGGTGLVGTYLTQLLLEHGFQVVIATRKPSKGRSIDISGVSYIQWNPETREIDAATFEKIDHIVNLAGAGVADKRWSKQRKQEIVQSRVDSGQTISNAILSASHSIKTLIQASAIGWYGPDHSPVVPFEETAPMDHHYLGTTCGAWEASVGGLPVRTVTLRIGIVLSDRGGALKEFIKPLRMWIAPVFASGQQIVSWIHIQDLCNMILFAIKHPDMQGIYNAVAPHPVSQKTLITALAQHMRPNFYLLAPVPAFALKILLGEMSVEVLKSATVSAEKIQAAGFEFLHQDIRGALASLVKKSHA